MEEEVAATAAAGEVWAADAMAAEPERESEGPSLLDDLPDQ